MDVQQYRIILFVGACLGLAVTAGAAETDPKPLYQKDIPVVITSPGSYRLASNLIVSAPNVTAIFVQADNVTIDLNGFTIQVPNAGGPGSGVNTGPADDVVVRNGVVRGFFDPAAACVHLPGTNNRAEALRVMDCPQQAIYVGPGGVVKDSHVSASAGGISAGGGSVITGNTLVNNTNFAIGDFDSGGVAILENNCRGNATCILVRTVGSRIEGNLITANAIGIDLTVGTGNFFARNFLHGNTVAIQGQADDVDGGTIDPALSNPVVP